MYDIIRDTFVSRDLKRGEAALEFMFALKTEKVRLHKEHQEKVVQYPALNFGIAKGMTFDRVLVFPHVSGTRWLKSGESRHIKGSLSQIYVGATRARYSLAYVYDGVPGLNGIQAYQG